MSSRPKRTPKRQREPERDSAALDSDADDNDRSDDSELARDDDDDDDDDDYRKDRAGPARSQDADDGADGSGAADSSDDGAGSSDDGDNGSLFGDEDDESDEAAPAGISPEEKEAMRTIQEMLMVPE